MNKLLAASLLLSLSLGLAAQQRLDLLAPKDARSLAMGGGFVAMSEGFQSFFGNPAAYASGQKEFSLLSMSTWLYMPPTSENIALAIDSLGQLDDISAALGPLGSVITSNGFGGGASIGTGYIGNNLAFGLVTGVDSYLYGKNLAGASGSLDIQAAAIIGLGLPVRLFGLDFSFGGNLRPFVRTTTPLALTDLLEDPPADPFLPTQAGFGLAVDLGARLDFGRFLGIGLAVRDITTRQSYGTGSLEEVLDNLIGGNLPKDNSVDYTVRPNITAGVSLRPLPASMSQILDLLVVMEIQDPIGVIQDQKTVWHTLHLGTEAKLLNGLLALRGGLNQGYISLGAGLKLLIFETNFAIFTEELGLRPGDRPRTGVALDFAIRF